MTKAAKKSPTRYRNQDKGHRRGKCVDCIAEGIATKRPAPEPGPRCKSHSRLVQARRKNVSREKRWLSVYGLSPEDYWAIHSEQGGVCYICRRATGTGKRRLSVDHCHETGVVRGLLCQHCNLDILGFARDEVDFFERAIEYLNAPPAVRAIGVIIVPDIKES